ncbi:hypothetical protein AB0F72_08495 [Actinoplanes sp. NPDC023936]|uniref:hypothetical protein n=1 Tax=Actinoplanes sp. NPDC023936 TaxID=3154910 RepID=UPI00340F6763
MDLYLELDKRHTLPANGALTFAYRDRTINVDYNGNTEGCRRCNRKADVHAWRVYDLSDPDLRSQGGVLDCGILGETR